MTMRRSRVGMRCAHQRGLTLIELMVALVVGLILTGGVIQIFISSQETYRFQESLSRIQETGRYATETIARDLRGVGFEQCGGGIPNFEDVREGDPDTVFGGGTSLRARDVDELGDTGDVEVIEGTSAIEMSRLNPSGVSIDDGPNKGEPPALHPDRDVDFDEIPACTSLILIQPGCTYGAAFYRGATGGAANFNTQGTGMCDHGNSHAGGNAFSQNLSGAQAYQMEDVAYFLGWNGQNEPALYRRVDGAVQELVEGVEDMALEFGEDTDPDPETGNLRINTYNGVDAVSDWANVGSARVSLLVRGHQDHVTDEPQNVSFPPGADGTPQGDNRLRQVFTTTVAIRNRLE